MQSDKHPAEQKVAIHVPSPHLGLEVTVPTTRERNVQVGVPGPQM